MIAPRRGHPERQILLVCIALILFIFFGAATEVPGQSGEAAESAQTDRRSEPVLTYADEAVTVVRAGRVLTPERLFGLGLEPADFLETGDGGVAEMRLSEPGDARIRIDADSAVMLRSAEEEDTLEIELLAGTVYVETGPEMRARVLVGEGTVTMRGGEVSVSTSPLGVVRVAAPEGRARARFGGRRLFVDAERAAVYRPAGDVFENTDRSVTPAAWRVEQEMEAERADADVVLDRAERYREARGAFDAAYRRLTAEEPHVLEWMRAEDLGRRMGGDTAAALAEFILGLDRARQDFEPLYRAVMALESLGRSEQLPEGLSEDARIVTERMHTARHLLRLLIRLPGAATESDAGPDPDSQPAARSEIPESGM